MKILRPVPNRFRGKHMVSYYHTFRSVEFDLPVLGVEFAFYWNLRARIASMVCRYIVWGVVGPNWRMTTRGFSAERIRRVESNQNFLTAEEFEAVTYRMMDLYAADLMAGVQAAGLVKEEYC